MRLATKNEILTILDDKIDAFAQFYLTSPTLKFKWDSATNFDLDLPVMQNMITGLRAVGIFDDACVARFAAFGEAVAPPVVTKTYRVPADYPLPSDLVSWGLSADYPGWGVLVVPYSITDGIAIEEP